MSSLGLLMKKVGCTSVYDQANNRVFVTLLFLIFLYALFASSIPPLPINVILPFDSLYIWCRMLFDNSKSGLPLKPPFASSDLTISVWSFSAAKRSGVHPYLSFALTSAPLLISSITLFKSPSLAACISCC